MRLGSGGSAWTGFQDLDVLIAVRPRNGFAWSKPASELVYACLAGVPALLRPGTRLRRAPAVAARSCAAEPSGGRHAGDLRAEGETRASMTRCGDMAVFEAQVHSGPHNDRWVEVLSGIARESGWRLASAERPSRSCRPSVGVPYA
jgi:hypothetical protein